MKHYIYIHYRASDNSPFYVGKGSGQRHKKTWGRNQYWKRVVEKHGFNSEIVAWFNTHEEALEAEIRLIKELEDRGEKLTNMTLGGEGVMGYVFSDKEREHQSKLGKEKMSELTFAEKVWEGHRRWKEEPKNLEIISGRNGNSYKGDIQAVNIETGESLVLIGAKEMRKNGFDHTRVYDCVNGKRKTHKGYIFKRLESQNA